MLEFITRYWVEVFFTGIIGLISLFFRRYLKLEKQNQKNEREEYKNMILAEVDKKNQAYQTETDSIQKDLQHLKKGVLSFQGKMFKDHCHEFLEKDQFCLEEFEELDKEHNAYNGLGGNHEGDILFSLAKRKVENEIIKQHNDKKGKLD